MTINDFDDIVFENINKEYGAYYLRKRYNRVVVTSIILAVLFGSISVLIPFLSKPEQKSTEVYSSLFVTMENLKPPGPTNMPEVPRADTLVPCLPTLPTGRQAAGRFFAHHLDYFIMTENSHPLPGLGTVKTTSS